MMSNCLPLGKLPSSLLKELIATLPTASPELIIPPGLGCDAAGLQTSGKQIAVTTDPITLATTHLAYYSVCVNINDVACMGCRPRWYSGTLLLPPQTTETNLRDLWLELGNTLRQFNMLSIGGHAEVTTAVNTPVLVGQVIGEVIGDILLNPNNIEPGDKILLWQFAGLEGTALIASEHKERLASMFSKQEIREMQALLHEPGICVWPLVEKLLPHSGIVAMHDPTEGGVATALHELADAAQCGLHVYEEKIAILPSTKKLSELFNMDPLGLLASGALLIVCKANAVADIRKKLNDEPIVEIGEFTQNLSRYLISETKQGLLPRFDRDEILKI